MSILDTPPWLYSTIRGSLHNTHSKHCEANILREQTQSHPSEQDVTSKTGAEPAHLLTTVRQHADHAHVWWIHERWLM